MSKQSGFQSEKITTRFNPVKLIEEVKRRPGLYSAEHPADREEKLALWKEVGGAIYPDWEACSKATAYDRVLQLQRKWRSLRDAYNRELRARRSGVRVNRRVYMYFKMMSFLGGFDGSISEEDETVSDRNNDTTPDDVGDDDPLIASEPVAVKKPRKRRAKKRPSIDSYHEELEMPVFTELPESEADSDRLFLLSFLPEMRQLPVNVKMWARAQIAGVMQEAVASQYSNTVPGKGLDIKRQRRDSSE